MVSIQRYLAGEDGDFEDFEFVVLTLTVVPLISAGVAISPYSSFAEEGILCPVFRVSLLFITTAKEIILFSIHYTEQ